MKNVTNLNSIFSQCRSLKFYCKDILKWDISNSTNMDRIFFGCSSIKFLTEIPNFDILKDISMFGLFEQ